MKCTVHGLFTSSIYRLLFEAIVMACVGVVIAWSVYHLHRWRSRLEAAAVTLSFFFFVVAVILSWPWPVTTV